MARKTHPLMQDAHNLGHIVPPAVDDYVRAYKVQAMGCRQLGAEMPKIGMACQQRERMINLVAVTQ